VGEEGTPGQVQMAETRTGVRNVTEVSRFSSVVTATTSTAVPA